MNLDYLCFRVDIFGLKIFCYVLNYSCLFNIRLISFFGVLKKVIILYLVFMFFFMLRNYK